MPQLDPLTSANPPDRQFQPALVKNLLEELIDRHAEAYLEKYPEVKEFSNYDKSGTVNYYIGMVWTNDFERPNANQLRVRGSQSLAKNRVLELDLSLVTAPVALFPGQIVAFQADPYLDRRITVRKFLDSRAIAPPTKKICTDDEIRLIVASGPFLTNCDQETWKLFDKMIETVQAQKATHVILVGPFIDLQNQQARLQFDTMWRSVFDRLVESLHDQECHVYLVPSNKDILPGSLRTSYFYPRQKINLKPNVKEGVSLKCTINPVSDPAQIDLGGLYVDVTSAEVQFHLNQSACILNKGDESVFQTFYRHMISHGIYPIYPAPADALVDHAKLEKYLHLDRLGSHLVILPTRFNSSLTEVDGRVFVSMLKCTVKKHVMLITIPKLGDEPVQFLTESGYTHQLIELVSKSDSQPASQQPPSSTSCPASQEPEGDNNK